ncbi:hypothetical protein VOLCADRAFT_81203 [Volvox carteri f. nagariensis]|uniref:F-box domain-containing protein n=1 Tax=Volvox carteri f. nagariensis TaxID=3068 RepID=D8TWA9_VOLCA|nr:uncharacterized protein VOLCADRAFT_81203 [Volvox carteri f. nagariensis]EFJ48339.1 hypothetical protein VOLCADRAFT_81203 [Volvox carteri f. nagariensis]|eukprot:XP_002950593.1 hypothetical protein VOLCADRAFT_81203 [Volvox carteri f. nagariensis]
MTLQIAPVEGVLGLYRPWLSLYGNRLQVPSAVSEQQVELALIQRTIPQELMVIIFSFLEPYALGKAALVCRQWRNISEHPRLWEYACHEAFSLGIPNHAERHKLMATQYRFSWKRMFVHHPHLRFDGLYAARNTYVRTGVVEFTSHRPVHLVSYFRYYRFLPDGTFLYRTSPNVVSKVANCPSLRAVRGPGGEAARANQPWDRGTKVYCALVYPNSTCTELRCRLAMASTHPGANNRLYIESIVTYDRELRSTADLSGQQGGMGRREGPDADADVDAASGKSHSRGLAPCMFVPWEQVHTSPLNQPSHLMDFMIV